MPDPARTRQRLYENACCKDHVTGKQSAPEKRCGEIVSSLHTENLFGEIVSKHPSGDSARRDYPCGEIAAKSLQRGIRIGEPAGKTRQIRFCGKSRYSLMPVMRFVRRTDARAKRMSDPAHGELSLLTAGSSYALPNTRRDSDISVRICPHFHETKGRKEAFAKTEAMVDGYGRQNQHPIVSGSGNRRI